MRKSLFLFLVFFVIGLGIFFFSDEGFGSEIGGFFTRDEDNVSNGSKGIIDSSGINGNDASNITVVRSFPEVVNPTQGFNVVLEISGGNVSRISEDVPDFFSVKGWNGTEKTWDGDFSDERISYLVYTPSMGTGSFNFSGSYMVGEESYNISGNKTIEVEW